jgi:hypothetical protein
MSGWSGGWGFSRRCRVVHSGASFGFQERKKEQKRKKNRRGESLISSQGALALPLIKKQTITTEKRV